MRERDHHKSPSWRKLTLKIKLQRRKRRLICSEECWRTLGRLLNSFSRPLTLQIRIKYTWICLHTSDINPVFLICIQHTLSNWILRENFKTGATNYYTPFANYTLINSFELVTLNPIIINDSYYYHTNFILSLYMEYKVNEWLLSQKRYLLTLSVTRNKRFTWSFFRSHFIQIPNSFV